MDLENPKLIVVCDIRKFSRLPVFTAEDLPNIAGCYLVPLASAEMQNAENEELLLITDRIELVRSLLNRHEPGTHVIFVGEYEMARSFAHHLEDLWHPCDETELLKLRFKWAVRRVMEHTSLELLQSARKRQPSRKERL